MIVLNLIRNLKLFCILTQEYCHLSKLCKKEKKKNERSTKEKANSQQLGGQDTYLFQKILLSSTWAEQGFKPLFSTSPMNTSNSWSCMFIHSLVLSINSFLKLINLFPGKHYGNQQLYLMNLLLYELTFSTKKGRKLCGKVINNPFL